MSVSSEITLSLGNVSGLATVSTIYHEFVSGDSISALLSPLHYQYTCSTGGTISETYVLSASLPPTSTMAAVPSGGGWLLIGVLLGLGIRVLHGSSRKGVVASILLLGSVCLVSPVAEAAAPNAGDIIAGVNGSGTEGGSGVAFVAVATGDRTLISECVGGSPTLGARPCWPGAVNNIAITQEGQIYINAEPSAALFRVDPGTGDRTLVSCHPSDPGCNGATVGSGPLFTAYTGLDIFPPTPPAAVSGLGTWAAPLLLGILIGLTVRVMRKGAVEVG
jgi:hypothetical protein